jgi:uncharacterized protein
MIVRYSAGVARALVFALALTHLATEVGAQQQPRPPSASAIAVAKEIIVAKGAASIYDPIVGEVVERTRLVFQQSNPMISRDLSEVAGRLRTEFVPRAVEVVNDVAKLYATRFSEQELKDALAFYKSALGKKIIAEEPGILNDSFRSAEAFAGKLAPEIMVRFRAEMKKKGHEL